jgi:hypothetical protein
VTEFVQKTVSQTAPITIHVTCLPAPERIKHLTEILKNYRKFFHFVDDEDEISQNEYQKLEKARDFALSFISTAFGDRFELAEELEKFLQDSSKGAEETIRSQLVQWMKEFAWPESDANDSGFFSKVAFSIEEYHHFIETFTGDRLFPFTKSIRYDLCLFLLTPLQRWRR